MDVGAIVQNPYLLIILGLMVLFKLLSGQADQSSAQAKTEVVFAEMSADNLKRIIALETERSGLQIQVTSLMTEVFQTRQKLIEAQSGLDKIDALQKRVTELERELKRVTAEMEDQHAAHTAETTRIMSERDEFKRQLDDMTARYDKLASEHQALLATIPPAIAAGDVPIVARLDAQNLALQGELDRLNALASPRATASATETA